MTKSLQITNAKFQKCGLFDSNFPIWIISIQLKFQNFWKIFQIENSTTICTYLWVLRAFFWPSEICRLFSVPIAKTTVKISAQQIFCNIFLFMNRYPHFSYIRESQILGRAAKIRQLSNTITIKKDSQATDMNEASRFFILHENTWHLLLLPDWHRPFYDLAIKRLFFKVFGSSLS